MLTLLINLDKSKDRLSSIDQQLREQDIYYTRISAVYGKELPEEFVDRIYPPSNHATYRYPHELSRGEIGCFLSHRECWKTLIQSNEKWGLVLEDDIILSNNFKKVFDIVKHIPENIHIVQLHYCDTPVTISKTKIPLLDNHLIRRIYPAPMGTHAYLISREAAQEALAQSETIDCPVDNFMYGFYHQFSKAFPVFLLEKAILKVADEPSTISDRKRDPIYNNLSSKINPIRLSIKLCSKLKKFFGVKFIQKYY